MGSTQGEMNDTKPARMAAKRETESLMTPHYTKRPRESETWRVQKGVTTPCAWRHGPPSIGLRAVRSPSRVTNSHPDLVAPRPLSRRRGEGRTVVTLVLEVPY